MNAVVKIESAQKWIGDKGKNRRTFGLMFERDITPTVNMAAGTSTLPPGNEQPKISRHEKEEEIYLIVRGRGKFLLDDNWFNVEEGTAIYVAPGVGHRAINTGDGDLVMFWVNSPSVFGPVGGYLDLMKGWERIR